jgi:hypothetical protein
MLYYPIVVAVLTLLSQGNLTHVTILLHAATVEADFHSNACTKGQQWELSVCFHSYA